MEIVISFASEILSGLEIFIREDFVQYLASPGGGRCRERIASQGH